MPRAKQFDKEQVLQKAMELFWKKGFHATSMNDLVEHLGVNRASLYSTFDNKEKLFEQAFCHYTSRGRKEVTVFFENHDSVKKGMEQLFFNAIQEAVTDKDRKGCFTVNSTTELIPNEEGPFMKLLDANKNAMELIFYRFLQRGVESGEISAKKNIKAISSMLFTLYNGLRVVAKVNPDPKALKAAVREGLTVLDG